MDAPASGMAVPYLEDEDTGQIVIKPLSRNICLVRHLV